MRSLAEWVRLNSLLEARNGTGIIRGTTILWLQEQDAKIDVGDGELAARDRECLVELICSAREIARLDEKLAVVVESIRRARELRFGFLEDGTRLGHLLQPVVCHAELQASEDGATIVLHRLLEVVHCLLQVLLQHVQLPTVAVDIGLLDIDGDGCVKIREGLGQLLLLEPKRRALDQDLGRFRIELESSIVARHGGVVVSAQVQKHTQHSDCQRWPGSICGLPLFQSALTLC
mmetsp:Transcript_586/g.1548  ORF Transcript_586/g.1548 Transcript_586/m.1548 type:complete len:233 (+) Transcript_586:650-1348(+)